MADQIDSAPEWRVIPRFPDFEASSQGQIRRCTPQTYSRAKRYGVGYLIKTRVREAGYETCVMKKTTQQVHRLVCEAYHGPAPSPGLEVAHWDGNKLNNVPSNLRWATKRENAQDTIRLGRHVRGEAHGLAKLNADAVVTIRQRHATGERGEALATEFGVTSSVIFKVLNRQLWAHVP